MSASSAVDSASRSALYDPAPLVAPEPEPLMLFGQRADAGLRGRLADALGRPAGVDSHTAWSRWHGWWMAEGDGGAMRCIDDPGQACRRLILDLATSGASQGCPPGWDRERFLDRLEEFVHRSIAAMGQAHLDVRIPADRLGALSDGILEAFDTTAMPSDAAGVRWARNEHWMRGLAMPPRATAGAEGWRPAVEDLVVGTNQAGLKTATIIIGHGRHLERSWHPAHESAATLRALRDGHPDGETQTWWPDGRPRSTGSWRLGLPHGVHREWDPSGRLVRRMAFVHGRSHGRSEIVDGSGCRTKTTWRNGIRVGDEVLLGPDGMEIARGGHRDGLRDGAWTIAGRRVDYLAGRERPEMTWIGWSAPDARTAAIASATGQVAVAEREICVGEAGRFLVIQTGTGDCRYLLVPTAGSLS